MYYAKIKPLDVANGTGIRVGLFVSGCRNHCHGCFNPETWNFKYGNPFTKEIEDYIIRLLNRGYIKGLSVLGGDPLEPENEEVLTPFLSRIKTIYTDKDIWLYTGYVYEQIKDRPILEYVDILVDGPFIEEKRNPKLAFRGSENQRILHLNKRCKTCYWFSDGFCYSFMTPKIGNELAQELNCDWRKREKEDE